MTGCLQRNIAVFAAVEPFLRVAAQKRTHGLLGENDEEGLVKSKGVFVVRRISSFSSGGGNHIVFSVVG